MLGTRIRKVASTAATVALVGGLATGMVAMQARPAEAILPVLPLVPILGGAAAGTGLTLGGVVAGASITAGVVGLGLALTQPGAMDFVTEPLKDFFEQNTDPATGEKQDTTTVTPPVYISTQGDADPAFDGYRWVQDVFTPGAVEVLPDTTRPGNGIRARITRPVTGVINTRQVLATGEITCRTADGLLHEAVITKLGTNTTGQTSGANAGYVDFLCSESFSGGTFGAMSLQSIRIRPATTNERKNNLKEALPLATNRGWASSSVNWQAKTYEPANPNLLAEVMCVNSLGVKTKLTAQTQIGSTSLNLPSCKAAGLGDVAESLVVGFADGDKIKQPIFTASPAFADQYMECDPVFGKVCAFQVYVDGKPCVVGSPACASWAGLFKVNPVRVQCMYGTKVVDMSGCAILEGAYVYGGTPAVKTNVDGNPDTWTDPGTVPGWVPHVEGDPGPVPAPNPGDVPVQAPNPAPAPDVTTTPEPGTDPGPGTGPGPGTTPSTTPMPTTGTNPSEDFSRDCFGTSWSWNPISWVAHPVACVLDWAFRPNPATVQAKGAEIHGRVTELGVNAPFEALQSTIDQLPQGGGCEGPTLTFSIRTVSESMQPLNACSGVMNTVANSANAFGSVYLLLFGSISVVRAISSAFGYNFTMGKTSDN